MTSRMSWIEQRIRRYEHSRWASEPNRRVLPFAWGLEHIGGNAREPDPRGFLDRWVPQTLTHSAEWFSATSARDYRLEDGVLTFTSAVETPWPENNRVHARFFPARKSGPAVVVMAQWNAGWDDHVNICRWLNRLGITALRLSLPYHDRRAVPGHPRADHLVGPNIGLTLQANRQAVCDVRHCLRWLEQLGYGKLGVLGTSIGSAIACITAAHEPAIRAAALLHVSTYFGDVVANGLTTSNVWESLRTSVTADELRRFWAPISPYPYVSRLSGTGQQLLAISGRYDPTFWPEFSERFFTAVKGDGVRCDVMQLPCGHYSLGEPPFAWVAGGRFGAFLFQALA
jgi:Alpha/beta hydrolase domain containing 18